MKKIRIIFLLLFCLTFSIIGLTRAADQSAAPAPWQNLAREALIRAMSQIDLKKGNPNLLVLTNAGYGQIGDQTTEIFLDMIQQETGCTMGSRSLLPVHGSVNDPLWFSIYRKDTGKCVVSIWSGKAFEQQGLDVDPQKILTPEGWKTASSGLLGKRIFPIVSLSLTWSANPPWPLLLAAAFHDHFCPGVNAGYIAGEYCKDKLPLGPDDHYVFVTAPAICPADALQVMFNTTAGKSSGFAMNINPKILAQYSEGPIRPMTIAMRVNKIADTCQGIVLGFNWEKAYQATGIKAEEIAPPDGINNPMFWISRVKMSRGLVQLSREQLLGYMVELKKFTGKAGLADKISAGDPYVLVYSGK